MTTDIDLRSRESGTAANAAAAASWPPVKVFKEWRQLHKNQRMNPIRPVPSPNDIPLELPEPPDRRCDARPPLLLGRAYRASFGLSQLSAEFRCSLLSEQLSDFAASPAHRITVLEAEVSELRSELKRLTAAVEQVIPSLNLSAGVFRSADDWLVFKVAVIGLPGDSDRRRTLIGWAEQFECGVDFEFLDIECGSELPPKTDAVLQCGSGQPIECDCVKLRVGFAGDSTVDSDIIVNLQTGAEVGRALAAAVCESKGSRDFVFENGGRTLRVNRSAEWGVRAWRCRRLR
jgi:hypothetical protein